jgi:hypothetical protein
VQVPPVEKLTSPPGTDFEPESVSETVAVQSVEESTGTLAGEQSTAVDVERFVPVTSVVPELVPCLGSPE